MHAKDKALTRSTILGKTDRELSADPTVYTVLSFGLVKAREKGSYLEGSRDRTGEVGTELKEVGTELREVGTELKMRLPQVGSNITQL